MRAGLVIFQAMELMSGRFDTMRFTAALFNHERERLVM
jgi:hypothetical protein